MSVSAKGYNSQSVICTQKREREGKKKKNHQNAIQLIMVRVAHNMRDYNVLIS